MTIPDTWNTGTVFIIVILYLFNTISLIYATRPENMRG